MKKREFLKFASSAATISTALPLHMMLAKSALAQSSEQQAKRALFVFIPDGATTGNHWHPPTGTINLRRMTQPLEPVKQKCLFIDGISMYGGKGTHDGGARKVLTANGGDSLEVVIGDHYRSQTPYSSLQMGVLPYYWEKVNTSYRGGNMLPIADDPNDFYRKLFSGTPPTPPSANGDLQVLSTVKDELQKIKQQLGTVEREKLDQHTDSLAQLEQRLRSMDSGSGGTGSASCSNPEVELGDFGNRPGKNNEKLPEMSTAMQQIAVAALACGLTQSINFQYAQEAAGVTVPGMNMNDHSASHEGGDTHIKSKIWWVTEYRKFIQRMDAIPDVGGSLLDNTVMMTYSEIGQGNIHDHNRIPFVIAGGRNLGLKSGTTITYPHNDRRFEPNGTPHSKLLSSVARAAGLPINSFGDGNGYLTEVFR